MSADKNTIRVRIYGTEYPIEAVADPAYIQRIAEYVDSRMKEIPGGVTGYSLAAMAILTALNIADELYKEREAKEKAFVSLDERIETLIHRADQALDQAEV